jgi:hypothetical protein
MNDDGKQVHSLANTLPFILLQNTPAQMFAWWAAQRIQGLSPMWAHLTWQGQGKVAQLLVVLGMQQLQARQRCYPPGLLEKWMH